MADTAVMLSDVPREEGGDEQTDDTRTLLSGRSDLGRSTNTMDRNGARASYIRSNFFMFCTTFSGTLVFVFSLYVFVCS
jgi:hypothetical protein